VLELSETATPSEIKTAYYRLSKVYHPDTNAGNDAMAEKFMQVAAAYEILGSADKRQAYDMAHRRRSPFQSGNWPSASETMDTPSTSTGDRKPQYDDLDLDYQNFMHFQRAARRRQMANREWQWPGDFTATPGYRYRKKEKTGENSTDGNEEWPSRKFGESVALERERREALWIAERIREKTNHKIPTFESQLRERQKTEKLKNGQRWMLFLVFIGGFTLLASTNGSQKRW